MDKTLFRFMCIFGDNKEHEFSEVYYLGCNICFRDVKKFKEIFAKCKEYGLIGKINRVWDITKEKYYLSSKGDSYIRDTAIRYGGDFAYYKYMDRSSQSYNKYGGS